MRVSIAFTGMAPIASTLPAVAAAEAHGLDGVWSAEHVGFHDAIVPSALYLANTERLEVGVVGLSAAGRHPGLLAMELSSLAELAPGRVRVQVGTGDPSLMAKLGRPVERPARSTTALVHALREALAGREMNVEHPGYAFRQYRISPLAPPPPIDVMAVRPLMVKTAARVGDGVALSVGGSKTYLRETVAAVEAELSARGRERADFRITALAMAVIDPDVAAARDRVKPLIAMAEPAMAEHLARGVIEEGALVGAAARGGVFAVTRLLTPEVIDGVALISSPDKLDGALAAYADTGIDELAVSLFAAPDEQPALIKLLAEARPGGSG